MKRFPLFASAFAMLASVALAQLPVTVKNPPPPPGTRMPAYCHLESVSIIRKSDRRLAFDITVAEPLPVAADPRSGVAFTLDFDLDAQPLTGTHPVDHPDVGAELFICIRKDFGSSEYVIYGTPFLPAVPTKKDALLALWGDTVPIMPDPRKKILLTNVKVYARHITFEVNCELFAKSEKINGIVEAGYAYISDDNVQWCTTIDTIPRTGFFCIRK